MIEVVVLLGAVSVLTIAVMDAIRLTLGQIFSIVDGF
jgi:Flp pilus assembly pilin Flp|tara:strand:+ start:954 stop:1064 length:111 start_codon:yes stop_codon:yes gene_type:complete